MTSLLSIFMPAYNAAQHIEGVLQRLATDTWQRLEHFYIVDDGSQDDTGALIERLAAEDQRITALHNPANRGYGPTVLRGLQRCREDGCDYAVCLHADGQYPPENIPRFIAHMEEEGIDILQGSRHDGDTALQGGMPRYKFVAGKILTALENATFRMKMTDYHSGFVFYSRRALDRIPFERLSSYFDFDLEVIATARATGLAIGEMPIPTRYADEVSYLNPVKYGLQVLRVMGRYLTGHYRRLGRAHPDHIARVD